MSQGRADLHRHLDGSVRHSTLTELAHAAGQVVPEDLCFVPGMGLQAALSRFQFTLSLLQTPDAVARVAHEICEDARREGVSTLEIRFAPQLHSGGSIPAIIDAALEGIAGRAGLIVCALYGDSPDLVDALIDAAIPRPSVVGIDLAGGPSPRHRWGMRDLAPCFQRAKDAGLGRTVHAGEGRPASEIHTAITQLHAQRIGHGLSVLESPEVAALVRDTGVTIEACPTSNWHVGVIDSISDHPLPDWLSHDLKVCINTDNTLLSATDSVQESLRAQQIPGVGTEGVQACHTHGHSARFQR